LFRQIRGRHTSASGGAVGYVRPEVAEARAMIRRRCLSVPGWAVDDESALYHHFELNYAPADTQSGRRLARR
jgi:hypothetical protein